MVPLDLDRFWLIEISVYSKWVGAHSKVEVQFLKLGVCGLVIPGVAIHPFEPPIPR